MLFSALKYRVQAFQGFPLNGSDLQLQGQGSELQQLQGSNQRIQNSDQQLQGQNSDLHLQQQFQKNLYHKYIHDFRDRKWSIADSVVQLKACIQMLVPTADDGVLLNRGVQEVGFGRVGSADDGVPLIQEAEFDAAASLDSSTAGSLDFISADDVVPLNQSLVSKNQPTNLQDGTSLFSQAQPTNLQDGIKSYDIVSQAQPINLQDGIKSYGLVSQNYSLEITLDSPSIVKTPDNEIIFSTLLNHFKIIEPLPQLYSMYLSTASKVTDEDESRRNNFIKELIDARNEINAVLAQCKDILDMVESDEEDEEFIEVDVMDPEELRKRKGKRPLDLDASVSSKLNVSVSSDFLPGMAPVFKSQIDLPIECSSSMEKPTEIQNPTPVNPELSHLFDIAPIVPHAPDLDSWSKTPTFQDISLHPGLEFHHRFLGDGPDSSERHLSTDTIRSLRQRVTYAPPTLRGDIPACGARLRNGLLCTRRDLKRCPVHGPIIQRNAVGDALEPSNEIQEPPKAVWEEIETQVNMMHSEPRTGTELLKREKKVSVRERISKKVKKMTKNDTSAQDLIMRDRMAFRW